MEEQQPESESSSTIIKGESYDHRDHGTVTVTGIWQRTQQLHSVQNPDEESIIVIRFVPGEDATWVDELAESYDDFLEATR